jgi:hypothetical protein
MKNNKGLTIALILLAVVAVIWFFRARSRAAAANAEAAATGAAPRTPSVLDIFMPPGSSTVVVPPTTARMDIRPFGTPISEDYWVRLPNGTSAVKLIGETYTIMQLQ